MNAIIMGALLFVRVYFDGTPVRCLVDTGSALTLVSPAVARNLPTLSPVLDTLPVTGIGGGQVMLTRHTISNVVTGQLGWPAVTVFVSDEKGDGESCFVGMNLLGEQDVILRVHSGWIELVPPLSTNGS